MKKFLTLILFSFINLYGQDENNDIIVKVFIISPCYPPELDSGAYLVKLEPAETDTLGIKNYYDNESGIIRLPSPGKYNLFCGEHIEPLFEIEINKPGVYEYRRYVSKISALQYVSDTGLIYKNCGEICEGYVEDLYENGNVRIRGNFINGKPKDSLVEFYHNGKVKDRSIYKNGYTQFYYDSIGNLEHKYWSNSRYLRKASHSIFVDYYPNGVIKFNASDKKRLVKIDCFYPDATQSVKQRKRYRIEYYENGNIKSIYKWKKRRDEFGDREFAITIQFFNEKGEWQKTEEQAEKIWRDFPQPRIAYTEIVY